MTTSGPRPSSDPALALREVIPSDLDAFYVQQLDPDANWMAAWVSKDPSDRAAFNVHWAKILNANRTTTRTIVMEGQVAGHISFYPHGDCLEATYWIGREFWGRRVGTRALALMLRIIPDRPITARAAKDNLGSLKVLQNCGFKIIGEDKGFANGRGAETEEYHLRLEGTHQDGGTRSSVAQNLLGAAYAAFNARDIDAALSTMTSDVRWPKAFKGGFAHGPDEIRAYWTEQWSEIDPHVEPVAFYPEDGGRILVDVHQVVRDLSGAVMADVHVGHRFTLADGLIQSMEVCALPMPDA